MLVLYVDDMLVTSTSKTMIIEFISLIKLEFVMTDLGAVQYFLGIEFMKTSQGLFLSQRNIHELLANAQMVDYKSLGIPIAAQDISSQKASAYDSAPFIEL